MIVEGLEFYYCEKEVEKWTSGVVAANIASHADALLACHAIFGNESMMKPYEHLYGRLQVTG